MADTRAGDRDVRRRGLQRASLGVAGVEAQHRFGITAAVLGLFSVLQLAVYAGL